MELVSIITIMNAKSVKKYGLTSHNLNNENTYYWKLKTKYATKLQNYSCMSIISPAILTAERKVK